MKAKKMLTALGQNKRRKITVLAVAFLLYVGAAAGIFSYLTSKDSAANKLTGKNGSVTIQEPAWDSQGEQMAKRSEPGMQIPKDPSGVNDGQAPLYIRLKMTIDLDDYQGLLQGTDTADGEVGIPTDAKRLKAITDAIVFDDSQFLTLDTAGNVSAWSISGCSNSDFVFDSANRSGNDDQLTFYFYYTAGESAMKVVKPGESTSELFSRIDIPIYKKDYLGVFDQGYSITLEAEGIPADTAGMSVEQAKNAFENN